jgi:hypothetical protein
MSRKRKENPTDIDRIEEGFQKSLARLTVPKIDPVDSRGIDEDVENFVKQKRKREEATDALHNILSQTKKIHSDVTGVPDTSGGKRRRTRRRSKKSKKRKTKRGRYRK